MSVIITCYNYGHFLVQAVESVLDQRDVDVEVIIVDDASTDGSQVVAQSLALGRPRVQVLRNTVNSGPVVAFNRGLERVSGRYLVRLDADDLLTPGALSRAVEVMEAFPTVGLVYGHPLHFTGATLPPPRITAKRWTVWPGHAWLEGRCRSGLSVITAPEVVMRSSVVCDVGGQNPLRHAHDMEMWLRIATVSDVAYIEGADQAWHRDHPGSLSKSLGGTVADFRERRQAFDVLFSNPAAPVPDGDRMWRVARAALARSALAEACHAWDRRRADPELITGLVAFATGCVPDVECLPEWRAFRRREVRASTDSLHPLFTLAAVNRGLRRRLAWRRWARHGVFERP